MPPRNKPGRSKPLRDFLSNTTFSRVEKYGLSVVLLFVLIWWIGPRADRLFELHIETVEKLSELEKTHASNETKSIDVQRQTSENLAKVGDVLSKCQSCCEESKQNSRTATDKLNELHNHIFSKPKGQDK